MVSFTFALFTSFLCIILFPLQLDVLNTCNIDRFSVEGKMAVANQYLWLSGNVWTAIFVANEILLLLLYNINGHHVTKTGVKVPGLFNYQLLYRVFHFCYSYDMQTSVAYAYYLGVYFLTTALKFLLQDTNCATGKFNSVSGMLVLHFFNECRTFCFSYNEFMDVVATAKKYDTLKFLIFYIITDYFRNDATFFIACNRLPDILFWISFVAADIFWCIFWYFDVHFAFYAGRRVAVGQLNR